LRKKERQNEIICPKGYAAILDRRFEEAIDHFLAFVDVDPDSIRDFDYDCDDSLESPETMIPKRTKLVSNLTFDPTRKSATVTLRANGVGSPTLTKEYSSRYSSFSSIQDPNVLRLQSKQESTLILPSEATSSSLSTTYRSLAFQTLADQVKSSVKNHPGNEWMFGVQNAQGQILRFRKELVDQCRSDQNRVLLERTPVRMDLSHSWLVLDSTLQCHLVSVYLIHHETLTSPKFMTFCTP
jgi:hypothetical protein